MIDFFHQGSNIGFSIHGVSGFFLLVYIIVDTFFILKTGSSIIHKFLVSFRIRMQLKKQVPSWWKIKKISIISIDSNPSSDWKRYECYVVVSPKYLNNVWINDYVKTNRWGKIVKTVLIDNIQRNDEQFKDELKQYKRDITLKEIGV